MARAAPALSEAAAPKGHAAQERKWRAESGLRTLTEAAEIMKDKQRLADIRALAKEQKTALDGILGMKEDA